MMLLWLIGLVLQTAEVDGGLPDEPRTTVVTGTRSRSTVADAPVTTEVMTRRQILETGARDVSEALQARPGVEVFPSLGGSQLRLQGLGPEYTLVVVDGQRTVGRVNGALDVSRYSVEEVEQLEVVKGPGSVVWGSDALAGVLQIVTRRPSKPFGAGVIASYGLLNQVDARASGEVSAAGWGARGHFAFGQRDAFDLDPSTPSTTGSFNRSFQGGLRGTYGDPNKGFSADLRASALSRIQRGVDSNPTGAVFDRGAADVLGEGSVSLGFDVGPGRLVVQASLGLWSRRFVLDQRGSSALDQLQDSAERNLQLTTMYDVVLSHHRLTVGLEGLGEQLVSPRVVGNQRQRLRGSVFVQDSWAPFPNTTLVLVPGLRVDVDSVFGVVLTPRLAVRFDPHKTVALRLAVGRGFRAPSFQESFLTFENPGVGYVVDGNPRLKPERSIGATLSADWQPSALFGLFGSLFWNELWDMIGFDSVADESGQRFTYANRARVRTRGGELQVTVSPVSGLSLSAGAAVTDARDLSTDLPLDNQALARGVAQVRWRIRQIGVTALVRGSLTSARPFVDGETAVRSASPFVLVDARLAKTLFERFELFAVGTNLAGAGNATDLPVPPRSFFAGASFTY